MNFHKWWDSLQEPLRSCLFLSGLSLLVSLISFGGSWGRFIGLSALLGLFVWRLRYLQK